jgi:hypothetical protein
MVNSVLSIVVIVSLQTLVFVVVAPGKLPLVPILTAVCLIAALRLSPERSFAKLFRCLSLSERVWFVAVLIFIFVVFLGRGGVSDRIVVGTWFGSTWLLTFALVHRLRGWVRKACDGRRVKTNHHNPGP